MRSAISVKTQSPEETRVLGAALAPSLLPGDVLSLTGELGAGKTVFVQGLVAALGVSGRVTSPTFALVHEYEGRFRIVHLDVYRLASFQEVLDLGFEELIDPSAILLVEWGEAVAPLLPARYLEIIIRHPARGGGEQDRWVSFVGRGDEWSRKLETMRPTAETLLDAASAEGSGPRFSDGLEPRDDREAEGGELG